MKPLMASWTAGEAHIWVDASSSAGLSDSIRSRAGACSWRLVNAYTSGEILASRSASASASSSRFSGSGTRSTRPAVSASWGESS